MLTDSESYQQVFNYPGDTNRRFYVYLSVPGVCAHDRSATYFAESIVSIAPFTSVMCENYDEVYQKNHCEVTYSDNHYRPTLNMSGHNLNYG